MALSSTVRRSTPAAHVSWPHRADRPAPSARLAEREQTECVLPATGRQPLGSRRLGLGPVLFANQPLGALAGPSLALLASAWPWRNGRWQPFAPRPKADRGAPAPGGAASAARLTGCLLLLQRCATPHATARCGPAGRRHPLAASLLPAPLISRTRITRVDLNPIAAGPRAGPVATQSRPRRARSRARSPGHCCGRGCPLQLVGGREKSREKKKKKKKSSPPRRFSKRGIAVFQRLGAHRSGWWPASAGPDPARWRNRAIASARPSPWKSVPAPTSIEQHQAFFNFGPPPGGGPPPPCAGCGKGSSWQGGQDAGDAAHMD